MEVFALDTAPAAAHTVALAVKDMDSVVRLPGMFLVETSVVDSLPGMTDRAVEVAGNIVEAVASAVAH